MADCIDDSCDLIEKSNASNATTLQRIDLNGSVAGDRYNDGDADNPSHVSIVYFVLYLFFFVIRDMEFDNKIVNVNSIEQ